MITPDFNTFEKLCNEYSLIPVCTAIPGDLDTPLSAFLKIDDGKHSFLLESVEGGERWARYSFLGSDPLLVVKAKKRRVEISVNGDSQVLDDVADPTVILKTVMDRFRAPTIAGLPEFFGGAVGYLSYDAVRNFERLPNLDKADPEFQDMFFMLTRDMVAFDNLSHKILLITAVQQREFASAKDAYQQAVNRLENLRLKLEKTPEVKVSQADFSFSPNMSPAEFERLVVKAKEHIKAGDVIQVVLSQRFEGPAALDGMSIYRGLRMVNPSPYMFFLKLGDETIAGSSPEVMVRLRNGEAVLRPIAGTRPRGATPEEDAAYEAELLADEKELAEHVMLVDLARNDLGRIAEPGTVKVDSFKIVERYSHVMHIVSNVRCKTSRDPFELIRATFPAGTLSGAPKIRAMEIIEELEPVNRGPYGGCIGYFSYSGATDMGITIRTVMMKGDKLYFQAGAGIVADSVPEKEYQETVKKSEAMRRALNLAQQIQRRIQ